MKNILFYIAGLCLLTQALGVERQLDATLLVSKNGLTVLDSTAPIQFKCNREWTVTFTENGQTATLRAKSGTWTLTGLSPDIAVAAVNEGATLVSAIAESSGVSEAEIQQVTSQTLAVATALAQSIGQDTFDAALSNAAQVANELLDSHGIKPINFNKDIMAVFALLGPSGTVIDASDVTVADIHKNALKAIGTVLNALASSGAISPSQAASLENNPSLIAAAASLAAGDTATNGNASPTAAADTKGISLSGMSAGDASALAAAAAAKGVNLSNLSAGDASLAAAALAAAGKN